MKKSNVFKTVVATGLISASAVAISYVLTSCGEKTIQTFNSINDMKKFFNREAKLYHDPQIHIEDQNTSLTSDEIESLIDEECLYGFNVIYGCVLNLFGEGTVIDEANTIKLEFKKITDLGGTCKLLNDVKVLLDDPITNETDVKEIILEKGVTLDVHFQKPNNFAYSLKGKGKVKETNENFNFENYPAKYKLDFSIAI
jgi:hypothetical protein